MVFDWFGYGKDTGCGREVVNSFFLFNIVGSRGIQIQTDPK